MNFQSDRRGTLSSNQQVARALGIEIVTGVYAAGDKLPGEAEILERFDISRTVLREAFKILSAKGLIVSKTRVGTKVLPRTSWNLFDPDVLSWQVAEGIDEKLRLDLTEFRSVIEPAAAAQAADRATEDEIAELRRLAQAMRSATATRAAYAEADLEFHKAIGTASGNEFMRGISAVIETALVASFTLSSPVDEAEEHEVSVRGHEAIVDAIAARDPDGAAAAMRAIIRHGAQRIAKASR
jgi:DNA-binding FadR family transcriptional regulator